MVESTELTDEKIEECKKVVVKAIEDEDNEKLAKLLALNFPVDTPLNRNQMTPLMLYAKAQNCDGILFLQ